MTFYGRGNEMVDLVSKNLSVKYGDRVIFTNVNMHLKTHEIITIIGSSGAGKSTLLNAIAGFIDYTGSISIDGNEIEGSNSDRTVVFQDSSLFPWFNVEENIAFSLRAQDESIDLINRKIHHLIELMGLEPFEKKRINQLSGGMKQRVAIARAMVNEPKFILMDEPFSALDYITKTKMQDMILNIAKNQNVGILLITHDLEEAMKCGNKIMALNTVTKSFDIYQNKYFRKEILNVNNIELHEYVAFKKKLISYLI